MRYDKEERAIKSTKEKGNGKKDESKEYHRERNLRKSKKERQEKKDENEEHHKAAELEKQQLSRPIVTGKVKSSVFISEDNAVHSYAVWRYRSTCSQCHH
jgi:hypothetical protein